MDGVLPAAAHDQNGFLLVHGSPASLVFVPEEDGVAFASADDGRTWKEQALSDGKSRAQPSHTDDGAWLLIPGRTGVTVVREPSETWARIVPPEAAGRLVGYCYSAPHGVLYLFGGSQLAWTVDSLKTWRYTGDDIGLSPFCGMGGGHL